MVQIPVVNLSYIMWFMWHFMSNITVNQNHSSFFISVLYLYKRSAYKPHKKSFCLATNCSYRVIRHQSIYPRISRSES